MRCVLSWVVYRLRLRRSCFGFLDGRSGDAHALLVVRMAHGSGDADAALVDVEVEARARGYRVPALVLLRESQERVVTGAGAGRVVGTVKG